MAVVKAEPTQTAESPPAAAKEPIVEPEQVVEPVEPEPLRKLDDNEYFVEVAPTQGSLGMELVRRQSPAALKIKSIKGGWVTDYNLRVPAEKQIKPQDVIVSVNGES